MQEENPLDKKVTLLHTHYFRWTIHSDCLKSLSPAYFASTSLFCIPSLSLLYRRRSKIWSIQGFQHCSDRAVNRSGVLHHSTTHDSKVISSLPPLSPSKDLQPSGAMFNIIGTVCRAHWTPERGLQRAELEGKLPSLQISLSLTFTSALKTDFLHSWSPRPSSASVSYIFCPYQTWRSISTAFSEVWDGT